MSVFLTRQTNNAITNSGNNGGRTSSLFLPQKSKIDAERAKYEAIYQQQAQSQNNGGFFGGLGYTFEKLGLGFLQSIEGIWDYTAGGLAKLFGADDWAEQQFANDWVNYADADEWFNPSDGWRVAGDVAGGIGTSLPALIPIGVAAAITYFSGGTLTPVAVTILQGTGAALAGLGAAGTGTKEAYQETGQLTGKEWGYGALTGATEAGMEFVSSAIGAGTGAIAKRIGESAVKEGAKQVGKQVAGAAVRQTLGKAVLTGFLGEAFEEGVQELIDPVWKRITYDPNAENATFQQVAYAALIGGLSGAIMSGADVSIRNGVNAVRGNNLVKNGKVQGVFDMAQQNLEFEAQYQTGIESFEVIQNTLAELQASLEKTGGEIKTAKQKMLLSILNQANTSSPLQALVLRSGENIVNNAESIVSRMNTLYRDENGNPFNYTVAQIMDGIDTSDLTSPKGIKAYRKSLLNALRTNSTLRTLAVMDAAGKLSLDTARYADAVSRGQQLTSQIDLNRFIESSSNAEKAAVAQAFDIKDWKTITAAELNQKIIDKLYDGTMQRQYVESKQMLERAKALELSDKPLPTRFTNKALENLGDGKRYNYGGIELAIVRTADGSYQIVDYSKGLATKPLSLTELNRVLKQVKQSAQQLFDAQNNASTQQAETGTQTEFALEAKQIDEYCRENIEQYAVLGDANQAMIRQILRNGRAAGVDESYLLSVARLSAKSGLNVVFSKELCFRKQDGTYADGAIDLNNNQIIVNPEANPQSRSGEMIIIHELTHAIYNSRKGFLKIMDNMKHIPISMRNEIAERYIKAGELNPAVLADEVNAHYAETTLTNKRVLERLCAEHQTLKDKILSFLKGNRTAYAKDERLSGASKRLYRQYKKLFDQFAAVNQGTNALESGVGQVKRFSLSKIDGKQVVVVDTDQDIFDGVSEKDYPKAIRAYMRSHFQGKIFPVGTSQAYVNRNSINEYAYPANRGYEESVKAAKMRAGTELDNLLQIAEYIGWTADDGHHPEAVRGWDKYKTRFTFDGKTIFEGEVQIKLIERGDLFYDITKIKNISAARTAGATNSDSVSVRDASTTIIPDSTKKSTPNTQKNGTLAAIREKYRSQTDYFVLTERKNRISIDNLVVKQELRGKGIGQAILNDILAYADEQQKTVSLTPTSEFGTKNRLKAWYKKNGFVENKGKYTDFTILDTMYRLPKQNGTRFALPMDISYEKAIASGDTKTAKVLVAQSALNWGAETVNGKPLKLYHGTSAFGFTQFATEFIYATPSKTMAQGYGRTWWADPREISKRYTKSDGTFATLAKNAKNILGETITKVTDSQRIETLKNFSESAGKLDATVQDAWTSKGVDVLESINKTSPLEVQGEHSDETLSYALDYVLSFASSVDSVVDEIINYRDGKFTQQDVKQLLYWCDQFRKYYNDFKSWLAENSKSIKGTDAENIYNLVMGYTLGDYEIDVRYTLAAMLQEDSVINERGVVSSAEALENRVEQVKNAGAYMLYGKLGNNPLVIDAQQAFWANIPVEQWGGVFTTETIAKRAKKEGYTGVLIKNVMDGAMSNYATNEYGDTYIFFDARNVKSADIVTYDDNGAIVPLSQRFTTQNSDIRYALPQVEQEAVEMYGTTSRWKATGYLLVDGTRLDFSGVKQGAPSGGRYIDHQDIQDLSYYDKAGKYGYDALIDFMQRGNIRIVPEKNGINLSKMPTPQQLNALRSYVEKVDGEIILDIENSRGTVVASVSYPKKTAYERIISDIRKYFEDGTIPATPSTLSQFRWALSNTDTQGNTLTDAQKRYFAETKVVDSSGNLRVMYHGTRSDEFHIFDGKLAGRNYQGYTSQGRGFYFADSEQRAAMWGYKALGAGKVRTIPVYLNAKNIFFTYQGEVSQSLADVLPSTLTKAQKQEIMSLGTTYLKYIQETLGLDVAEVLQQHGYDAVAMDASLDSICVFKPNQIKLTTNQNPTTNADIRYALTIDGKATPVEVETNKNLVALHNLSEAKLLKVLDLGGFPMPSIAVTKFDMAHNDYGDITVIFGRDTIDPQRSTRNKVYSRDGWTPVVPAIEYKPNETVQARISKKFYELSKIVGSDNARVLYNLVYDAERQLQLAGGEYGLLAKLYDDTSLMQLFLLDSGKEQVAPIYREVRTEMPQDKVLFSKQLIEILGKDFFDGLKLPTGETQIFTHRRNYLTAHKDMILDALAQIMHGTETVSEARALIEQNLSNSQIMKFVTDANNYLQNNGVSVRTEFDSTATEAAIRKAVSQAEYKKWVDALVSGIQEKTGIRNNVDPFTRSGSRRSFEATHYAYTLENIISAMLEESQTGNSFLHGLTMGQLAAKLSIEFKSIEEMRKRIDSLKVVDEATKDQFSKTSLAMLQEITDLMVDENRYSDNVDYWTALDSAAVVVGEIADNKLFTLEKIGQFMRSEYKTAYRYNDVIGGKILALFEYVKTMTDTDYFEAKPRRAVGLNEIVRVLLPESASEKLTSTLDAHGIEYTFYKQDQTRADIISQMSDVRFALPSDDTRRGGLTKGQRAKFIANNTQLKVYSRADAEAVINSIIDERLIFEEAEKYGTLSGKNMEQAIDMLFQKLNNTPENYRLGVALHIADYIIENAVLSDMFDMYDTDNSYGMAQLAGLRSVMRSINLSAIESEIKYRYDTRAGVIKRVWGAKTGGRTADVVMQDTLSRYGIRTDAITEADIFFAIVDRYESLRDSLNKKVEKVKLTAYGSEAQIESIRQKIAKDILLAYDEKGVQSKYGKLVEKYTKQIQSFREQIAQSRQINTVVNRIVDTAAYLRDVATKRNYVGAEVFNAPELTSWLKDLGKLKLRGDMRKSGAREILANFGKFYNKDNVLLYDVDSDGNPTEFNYIQQDVLDAIDLIKSNIGSTKLLSLEELKAAQVILGAAKHLYETYDQITFEGKKVKITELAQAESEILANSKNWTGKGFFKSLHGLLMKIVEPRVVIKYAENFDPNGVLTRAYKAVTDGETGAGLMYIQLMQGFDAFFKRTKGYKKRLASEYITVCGKQMTVGDAISLFELSKREQAQAGIYESGVIFQDKQGTMQTIKPSRADIAALEKVFTDTDRQFIALVEKFFNVDSKKIKTDADIEILGYTNAADDFYFPITRYSGTIAKNITDARSLMADWQNVYNFSFNKDVKAGAKNKLQIRGVFDVITRHAKQLSTYANLTVPLKNFNQLYTKNIGSKTDVVSVKNILYENVWGGMDGYLSKLFKDIQGTATSNSVIEKLRGSFAKFQLGANLKVFASQVTSYPTAGIYLDIDAMAKGAVMHTNWAAMDEYCPYARVRNYERGIVRAEGVIDKVGKVGDILTKPIQWSDRFTIGRLWNACQVQVQKDAGHKIGTVENMKAAGVLLEDVIRMTQPNYTNTERSELMRSDSDIVRSFTMFTSVPLKQLSRLVESIGEVNALRQMVHSGNANADVQARYKAAKRTLARTLASITVANLMYVLVAQFFNWLYAKDKKDKDGNVIPFWQSLLQDFASTTIGMFPIIKDIYAFFANDYEISSFWADSLNNILQSSKDLFDMAAKSANGEAMDTDDYLRPLRNCLYAIGQLTGIPTRNINNTVVGLVRRFDPSAAYKYDSLFYNAKYSQDINNALKKGDTDLAETIMSLLLDKDKAGDVNAETRKVLIDLYGKGYTVLPKSVGSVTHDGETIKLTAAQVKQFKAIYGKVTPFIEKMVKTKSFAALDDEHKAKAIKQAYDAFYDKAVAEVLGIDKGNKMLSIVGAISLDRLSPVLAGMSAITSDKDGNGNTIANSKKRKIIQYLYKQALTDGERLLLLYYAGYTIKDRDYKMMSAKKARNILVKYILRLKVPKNEKVKLAEMCGFTVKNGRIIAKSI